MFPLLLAILPALAAAASTAGGAVASGLGAAASGLGSAAGAVGSGLSAAGGAVGSGLGTAAGSVLPALQSAGAAIGPAAANAGSMVAHGATAAGNAVSPLLKGVVSGEPLKMIQGGAQSLGKIGVPGAEKVGSTLQKFTSSPAGKYLSQATRLGGSSRPPSEEKPLVPPTVTPENDRVQVATSTPDPNSDEDMRAKLLEWLRTQG